MSHNEALQRRARRLLPRVAFDFVDGGADDEVTLKRNRTAFDDLALVPRVLRGVGDVSASTEVFGQPARMPVVLGPASAGLVAGPGAYTEAARAASAAGTISGLGAFQTGERIAEPEWFQLVLARDPAYVRDFVERAKRAGASAVVLTADTPVAGNRERDVRNRLTVPLRIVTPRIAVDAIRRPRWLWSFFASGANRKETFARGFAGRVQDVKSLAEFVRDRLNPHQTWDDLQLLRKLWDGPLVLKGVMSAPDAELAVEAGCEGIVVSNHGGRQLDGTPASIEVLPEIVAAVNGRAEVLLDSGVRRGTDVVKALCLGAKACLVGRPWVFSVSVGGQAGVAQMLAQFHAEIIRAMQLLGARTVAELGPEFVRRRPGSGWVRVGGLSDRQVDGAGDRV